MGATTMLGMVIKLAAAEVAIHVGAREALERVCMKVEKTAHDEIGTYQAAIGPFAAWAELADSTKEDRVKQGFTENDPLFRTGELQGSLAHEVHELVGTIGSTSEIMEWQEFGTSKMPPRPVLGPALVRNHHVIIEELGGAVVNGVVGREVIHPSLGYAETIA
jgi:HK97 gp10 family phage protein